jgi:hypothetical protein
LAYQRQISENSRQILFEAPEKQKKNKDEYKYIGKKKKKEKKNNLNYF